MYVYRWAWEDNENSKKSSYMYYKENIHYYMYKKTLFKPNKRLVKSITQNTDLIWQGLFTVMEVTPLNFNTCIPKIKEII